MARTKKQTTEVAQEEIQEVAVAQEQTEESEDKKEKKKEKKKLSETELKRVMTDTKETLVPLTDYIACSVHLGTKVITPDMRKFVYKRRADGLAVLNTNLIDDKLREGLVFLNKFAPEDIFLACKREAAWPAVEKFSEVTGIRSFMKKYPAGIITNIRLETFFEPKLALICDPWVDKNALHDANLIKIPVLGICDTNNYSQGVTQVIAGNNKSRKSLGLILFILAKNYLKSQGKDKEAKALKMEDFTGKLEVMQQTQQFEAVEKVVEGV
jgi:small subunit ribosomal protein S2